MYISGTIIDLASRMHQLAIDQTSLNAALAEARTYVSGVGPQISGSWEHIARMQKFQFTKSIADLSTQQL